MITPVYPESCWYGAIRQRLSCQRVMTNEKPKLMKVDFPQAAAQPKNTRVTKSRSGLGVLRSVERKQAYTSRVRRTDRNSKTELNQLSERKWVISDDSKGVNVQSTGGAEGTSLIESLKLVGEPNRKGVYRVRVERKLQSQFVSPYRNRALVLGSGEAIDMGRKQAASKVVEEAEDTTLPENLVYASEKLVVGQKTFGCYRKEFERIEWDDEEQANYWLNQFGALTALKLTHIEPDLIAKLVNAYNPVTNRIDLLGFEDVLCESMITDCFNLKSEGIVVSRNPELQYEWISHCYPEYAVPEDIKKEYYVAARCVDPEWKNKISWVLRHVLGRAEGREIPKGVLGAMIQVEVEGEVVNWAANVFERIRRELRRLKAIRKGDHLKCEAGPLLTMIAEYVAYQKKDKEKTQKKPAPPAPTVSSTPSGRTRASKRKVAEGSTPPEPKKSKKPVNKRRLIQDDDTEDSPSLVHSPSTLVTAGQGQENSQVTTTPATMTLPAVVNQGEAGTSSGATLDKLTYEQAIHLAGKFLEMQEQQARTLSYAQTTASMGSGQITVQTVIKSAKEASTSSSPEKMVQEPGDDIKDGNTVVNRTEDVDPVLEKIFTEQVSPEIQEAAEETLAAAQFYISRRQEGTSTGLPVTIPIALEVTRTNASTVVSEVVRPSSAGVHPDQVAAGDNSVVAEPVVRVVAQNPIMIAEAVKERSTPPEDKSSKTRSQYIREQLRETLPDNVTEDSSVLEATTSLVELAELVSENEAANMSTKIQEETVPTSTSDPENIQRTVNERINLDGRNETEIRYNESAQSSQPPHSGGTMYREKLLELLKGKTIAKPESEVKELREAHHGRISEAAERNNLPTLGEFNTVQFPPAAFEQIGYLRAMENHGYLDWLKLNSRPRAAEALNSLLPEHRECWLQLTQFGNSLIASSTGVFLMMEELYLAYDLIVVGKELSPTGGFHHTKDKNGYSGSDSCRAIVEAKTSGYYRGRASDGGYASPA
ncbi:hypothetical protein R1sor_027488 [Riccia sorocarpa]|uniref:Uncharacterized protein n=1 Tax=Riccia sorocarpa TaxID=122646 RepID=A0ABD3GHH8_9MARC